MQRTATPYPLQLTGELSPRLSRGLGLVKWWLLAIPHYLVVAVFAGGGWAAWSGIGNGWMWSSGGLVGLLVLFAGGGPPFRLDMGGDEPPTGTAPDTVSPTPAPVAS